MSAFFDFSEETGDFPTVLLTVFVGYNYNIIMNEIIFEWDSVR